MPARSKTRPRGISPKEFICTECGKAYCCPDCGKIPDWTRSSETQTLAVYRQMTRADQLEEVMELHFEAMHKPNPNPGHFRNWYELAGIFDLSQTLRGRQAQAADEAAEQIEAIQEILVKYNRLEPESPEQAYLDEGEPEAEEAFC